MLWMLVLAISVLGFEKAQRAGADVLVVWIVWIPKHWACSRPSRISLERSHVGC